MSTDNNKKCILVVDDSLFGEERAKIDQLQTLIPDADIAFGADFIDVKDHYDQGKRPIALIVDCSGHTRGTTNDMGNNWAAINLNRMFDEYQPEQIPATILVQSGDMSLARDTVSALQQSLERKQEGKLSHIQILPMDRHEITLATDLLRSESISADDFKGCKTRNLLPFLARELGLPLPATPEEEAAYVLKSNPFISPGESLDMLVRLNTPLPAIVQQLRGDIKSNLKHNVQPRVDYGADLGVVFMNASGVAAKGPVAFSLADVDKFHAEGKKSVFIMREYDPDLLPKLIGKISGLVAPSVSTPAHLAILMESHGIAGLFGANPNSTNKMDIIEDENPVLKSDGTDIHAGDIITLEPHYNTLHLRDCRIYDVDERAFGWMSQLSEMLRTHLDQAGIHIPAIKMSADSLNAAFNSYQYDGCGLIRTELILFTEETARASLRQAVMTPNTETLSAFGVEQEDLFRSFMRRVKIDRAVRVRLLDAKPEEFFSADEVTVLKARHGEENIRGVQLADRTPGLYTAQTEALFRAYKHAADYHNDCLASGEEEAKPLEILIPTIRTAFETVAAREMVRQAALAAGLEEKDYRFGVMMETLEAGQSIEEIVPHCDFISIGSNDYTAESLNCDRGNWEKRHQLALENGNHDPFTSMSHPKVLGELTNIVERARRTKPDIQIDLCGEHGANALSLHNMAALRLNAVSVRDTFRNAVALPLETALSVYDMHSAALTVTTAPAP